MTIRDKTDLDTCQFKYRTNYLANSINTEVVIDNYGNRDKRIYCLNKIILIYHMRLRNDLCIHFFFFILSVEGKLQAYNIMRKKTPQSECWKRKNNLKSDLVLHDMWPYIEHTISVLGKNKSFRFFPYSTHMLRNLVV